MNALLYSSRSMPGRVEGLLLSVLLSLAFVAVTFPPEFVLGTSAYWQTETDDVTQYVAGFNAYFTAPWQWPLLAFNGFNYPSGTLVTFVDAIPLYALLLKVWVPEKLAPFNPFGFWVAGCFLLQGVAAWSLTRALQVKSWVFLITLTGVLLAFPALMARIGHISLMSHWVLLFALALYIQGRRRDELPVVGWTVLLALGFYVNIYLFAMASGIYGAAWFSSGQKTDRRHLRRALLPCGVLFLTLWVTMLPLPPGKVTPEWGFGYYSMNLLSPFLGGSLIDVPFQVAPGQYEGYNYLGLGVLLAFGLALVALRGRLPGLLRAHQPLVVLMVLYTLYALSNQIYWGAEQIAVLPYPGISRPITSQFRASGRFFWPVGYLLVIFSFYALYKSMRPRALALTMAVLLVVQVVDLHKRHQILVATQARTSPAVLQPQVWDSHLHPGTRHLYFYPKFKCGKDPHGTLLPLMKYASQRRLDLNTGYIARYTPNCNDTADEIAASSPADTAYVFVKGEFPDEQIVRALFPVDRVPDCHVLDFALLCQYPTHPKERP
jgi:Family of unknown function (DUF6311)